MLLSKKGTYALVMPLSKTSVIKLGQVGVIQFQSGWYVYVGSAFGPGGLKARTDRHKRTDKQKHWHIDYLRDIQPIAEIWFSYTRGNNAEHAWAQLLSGTVGANVP